MTLSAGVRLGPYEITGSLGAGGMGEVYRARDTRLERSVAIKVLPAELAADPDRRARFEREARTISTLNHPHICALYDVGDHAGVPYLVMEHLAGETLAARLAKGPLPLDQALDVGAQIAEALDAAHKHGIVHRDLKPANVMLTKASAVQQGALQAKLLDFGLAKLRAAEGVRLVRESSATVTQGQDVTAAGTLVGTLPYMAPEQVEGREADARTDLWALGCLLYEMLTGQRAFEGATAGSLVGAILAKEPAPLATRQPLTPPALERLVKRCLAKDPDQRWDSAHDVADELRWMRETSAGAAPAFGSAPARLRRRFTAAVLVGLTTVLAASGAYLWGRRAAPPSVAPALIHATIDVRPAKRLTDSWRTDLTWTADGRSLVFAAEEGNRGEGRLSRSARLYIRRLDETVAHPLPYTVGGNAPFVSPDGQWVGFWVEAERPGLWEMRKVALGDDRPPVTICQVPNTFPPMGASWGDDGTIVFAFTTGGLWAVPDRGGTPRRLTELERGEVSHRLPHVLPGSRAVLFTIRHTVSTWGHEQIGLLEFVTGKRMVVEEAGTDARYAPTGHLVFLRLGTLLAVPFDLQRLRVSAGAVPLFGQVSQAASIDHYSDDSLAGQFAISRNGDLALVRTSGSISVTPNEMLWVDRDGRQTPLPGISWPGAPIGSRMSPDGARAVVLVREPTRFDLWVLDLARGTLGRLTTGDEVDAPVWSPDGREIVFARPAMRQIVRRSVDRGDREVVVFEAPEHDAGVPYPSSWGPGNVLAITRDSPTRGFDIGTIDMDSPAPAFRELLAAPVEECWPVFSPDGKWLAYVSDETERLEVYVRPYPSLEPKIHVSKQRGMGPVWGATGRELFFAGGVNGNISLTALTIDTTGGRVRLGSETRLFAASHDSGGLYVGFPSVYYSVTRDGRRFLMHKLPLAATPPQVTGIDVVLNWSVELKAKVPTGK